MTKIKSLGANKTELHINSDDIVFFSYETPVAAFTSEWGFIRTGTKYSVTTSKHINQWLASHGCPSGRCTIVPQETIDGLMA